MPIERAVVVGASGGIGGAVAQALRSRGAEVRRLSRREDGLDITDPASVKAAFSDIQGPYDLIFVATGILMPEGSRPEKSLASFDAAAARRVLEVNAIGPMLVLQEAVRLLPKETRGVLAALSARVGSIGDNRIGGWHAYRASKSALNMYLRGVAIELSRSHRKALAVALHPGTVETEFTAAYPGHRKVAAETAAANLLSVIDGLQPAQSGGFFDYAGKEIPW